MNLFKIFGLGAFYRARRLSKAVRNWRKFGVILFGSLFLASNLGANLALAATMIQVTVSPTSSEITLGSTKQFSAQVHSGTLNVTNASDVSWTAYKGTQSVATGNGATFNFTPATEGNFVIRAAANYKGQPATLREPATLLVKPSGDNTQLSVVIAPANSTITVGQTQAYTPVVKYGTTTVTTASTLSWVVKQNGMTVKTGSGQAFSYAPVISGDYTVVANASYTANGVLKTAASNTANLHVNPGSGGGDANLQVTISPTSAEITLGGTKTYTAQVHSGTLNVTSQSSISWTASKNGVQVATGTGVKLNLSPSTTGTFVIRAEADYKGKPAILREPATLLVKNGGQPPVTTCSIQITNSGTGNITLGQVSPLYTATVMSNGSDVTNQVNIDWSVRRSGDAIIHFTGSGKTFGFTPTQTGTYSIQARTLCGDVEAIAVVTLTVNPGAKKACTIFEINPKSVTLPLVNGMATQQFTLRAEDSVGDNNVTLTNLVWEKNGVGSLSSTSGTKSTVYTATSTTNGTFVTVRGLCNGVAFADTATVKIIDAPNRIIERVVITPDNPSVLMGTTQQYHATAYDDVGPIDPSLVNFAWTPVGTGFSLGHLLNNTGDHVTFQTNTGLVSDTYHDFLQVTATYLGLSATDKTAITLYQLTTQKTLNYVTMQPDRNPIYTNDSTPVRAQAYDNLGAPIDGCAYNWIQLSGAGSITSATNQQVITFSSQSLLGAGNLQVTATCLGSSVFTTGSVQIISAPANLRVELTPDPAYMGTNSDILFIARAYDNNVEVTNSTVFSWAMLNNIAGTITSTNANTAIVRTGNQLGTFGSAIQVTGTRNGMTGSDAATIVIQSFTPVYDITPSIVGSLNSNGTATCSDDIITYTVTVTNNNINVLTGVRVAMGVPANTSFLSATSLAGSPSVSGHIITWNVGTLGAGQSQTMTVRVTPANGLAGTKTINASAFVSFDQKSGEITINANPINLVCGTTPDGKGPLPTTGMEWQMLVALMTGALGLTSITYAIARRKGMNQN